MSAPMHNLLTDPVIDVTDDDGTVVASTLPEVLARLVADDIAGFPALRTHQAHAWHALLVQVAALALHRAGVLDPPRDAEAWAALLRGLTPGYDDEPWCLVVEDWRRPAFLQPPAPLGAEAEYRGPIAEPDQIDLLVTAKNHDVKAARMAAAAAGHWLFALVALQTMEGFLGAGNYGVSRMNGGFSSRPCLGLTPSLRPGVHFRRDLRVMLARRSVWLEAWPFFRPAGGLALLWLEPWDGTESLDLGSLDPWYVEICRRIRLRRNGTGIHAVKAGSKCSRVAASAYNGNVGDPWTPIDKGAGKALSLTAAGFRYDRLQELLFVKEWEPAPLQRACPGIDDPPLSLVARGLARGQGQTAGYHERVIPVPAGRGSFLPDDRDRLGIMAKRRVDEARTAERHVLWPALLALHEDAKWASRWIDAMDGVIDAEFFASLWEEALAEDPDSSQTEWRRRLRELAEGHFAQAAAAVPRVSSRDYKIRAQAESLLRALLRKHFGDLFAEPTKEATA